MWSVLVFLVTQFILSRYLYIDYKNKCFIKVVPSALMPGNLKTPQALKFLKETSTSDYLTVCKNVKTINKNPSCGGFDGGCYNQRSLNTIYLGNDQGNIAIAAALIVHETCHVTQGLEKKSFDEQECQETAKKYLNPVVLY